MGHHLDPHLHVILRAIHLTNEISLLGLIPQEPIGEPVENRSLAMARHIDSVLLDGSFWIHFDKHEFLSWTKVRNCYSVYQTITPVV